MCLHGASATVNDPCESGKGTARVVLSCVFGLVYMSN